MPCIAFLAQDKEPMPLIQLVQDSYCAKFVVSDQENSCLCGEQGTHIGQQSQMLMGACVSSNVIDPGPGNRDGSFRYSGRRSAMIRNQWYVVLESDEVGTHPVGVTRLGEKMVFWRDQAVRSAPPWIAVRTGEWRSALEKSRMVICSVHSTVLSSMRRENAF